MIAQDLCFYLLKFLVDLIALYRIMFENIRRSTSIKGDRGGTVVKVLCYKLVGSWFNSRWCHWNFSLT